MMEQFTRQRRLRVFWLVAVVVESLGGGVTPSMAEAPAPGAIPAPSPAEVRVYRNRQERRQDSPKREIASGVGVAVIGDLEYSTERLRPAEEGVTRSKDDSFSQSLELELEIKRADWIHAAVVWEYTHDEEGGRDRLSEAFITLMAGDFELEVGRLFAPFGEYLSYFATGPALEFAETGLEGGVLSYGPSNRFDASLFGFKGEHRGMVGRTGRWDWGLALEFAPREKLRFGLGYLSDLAEAGEGLLERGARYERRVAGWNGFVEISAGPFTGTAEIVRALDSFVELEAEVDRPTAWNLELAWHAEAPVIAAVRLEGSRKLDGAPRRQIGASLIWGIRPNLTLTLEYLHSRYAPGLREDAAENEIERTRKLGAQLSFNF